MGIIWGTFKIRRATTAKTQPRLVKYGFGSSSKQTCSLLKYSTPILQMPKTTCFLWKRKWTIEQVGDRLGKWSSDQAPFRLSSLSQTLALAGDTNQSAKAQHKKIYDTILLDEPFCEIIAIWPGWSFQFISYRLPSMGMEFVDRLVRKWFAAYGKGSILYNFRVWTSRWTSRCSFV